MVTMAPQIVSDRNRLLNRGDVAAGASPADRQVKIKILTKDVLGNLRAFTRSLGGWIDLSHCL